MEYYIHFRNRKPDVIGFYFSCTKTGNLIRLSKQDIINFEKCKNKEYDVYLIGIVTIDPWEIIRPASWLLFKWNYVKRKEHMLSHQIQWNTKEYEWFQFVTRSWNVQKAKRILKKKSYESIEIEVDTFAKLLSQERETSKGRMFVMGVGIDEERLDEINLDFPLIAVRDPVLENMVIDGWHRIAKAQKLGVKLLNGFLLDEEDSRKVLFKTCR